MLPDSPLDDADRSLDLPSRENRRSFLQTTPFKIGAVLAAVGAASTGTYLATKPDSREKKILKLRNEFIELRTALADEYAETGTIKNPSQLRRAALFQELLWYLESPKPETEHAEVIPDLPVPESFEQFEQSTYRPFADAVLRDLAEFRKFRGNDPDARSPHRELTLLKMLLEDRQGTPIRYNEAFNSPLFGMIRCKDGTLRVQCASNTQLLLLLAEEAGIRGVVDVHASGHTFVGTVDNGNLTTVEMTSRGSAEAKFGSLQDLRQNPDFQLRVMPVRDAFATGMLRDPSQIQKAIASHALLDTAPRTSAESSTRAPTMNVRRRDPLAFGVTHANPGDKPLTNQEHVDPRQSYSAKQLAKPPAEREVSVQSVIIKLEGEEIIQKTYPQGKPGRVVYPGDPDAPPGLK